MPFLALSDEPGGGVPKGGQVGGPTLSLLTERRQKCLPDLDFARSIADHSINARSNDRLWPDVRASDHACTVFLRVFFTNAQHPYPAPQFNKPAHSGDAT
jgi:hypothetical protein